MIKRADWIEQDAVKLSPSKPHHNTRNCELYLDMLWELLGWLLTTF
jgi:heme oxygenase